MKRILALLLAGLLLLSLSSCFSGDGDSESTGEGTNDAQSTDTDTDTDGEDTNDEEPEWEEVDETVYTFKSAMLREEINGETVKSLDAELTLRRTHVSEDWSRVEVTIDGEKYEGYISNKYITKINILGTDMTAVSGGSKIMYSNTEGARIRKYPSTSDSISSVMASLKKDDEVKVVAYNDNWCKIEYVEDEEDEPSYYYVSRTLLSETKGGKPEAPSYESKFTPCEEKVMYTSTANVVLRSAPYVSTDTKVQALPAGVKFVVTKTGAVEDSEVEGGLRAWSYGTAFIPPVVEGGESTQKTGYIATAFLTETEPDKPSTSLTLEQLLARYPSFTAVEMPIYIVQGATVNVRSTPDATSESNGLGSLKSTDVITSCQAVAKGEIDGKGWYVIKYTNNDGKEVNAFITARADATTVDATGAVKLTRDNLKYTYPEFEMQAAGISITTNAVANCYNTLKKNASGYESPKDEDGQPITPAKQLTAGETVTLVACEAGATPTWYAVEIGGAIYFTPVEYFNAIETLG